MDGFMAIVASIVVIVVIACFGWAGAELIGRAGIIPGLAVGTLVGVKVGDLIMSLAN